jgi:hypothetical protein
MKSLRDSLRRPRLGILIVAANYALSVGAGARRAIVRDRIALGVLLSRHLGVRKPPISILGRPTK